MLICFYPKSNYYYYYILYQYFYLCFLVNWF